MKKVLFSLMTLMILVSCGTNSSVTETPEVPTDNSINTVHNSYTPDAQIISGSVTDDAMVE